MSFLRITPFFLAAVSVLSAQGHASTGAAQLPAHATLPITFTATVSAAHAKAGDTVKARTMQPVHLADGRVVPSGAIVLGHVVQAAAFEYDKTPYAKQAAGTLRIQIDSLEVQGTQVPLNVTLRAMADPLTSRQASEPKSTDLDSLSTTTQVGGDQLTPSQSEIRNQDGDVVGYNKHGGAFAHLLANSRDAVACDAGDTEQPVAIFSASACGLYGFYGMSLLSSGNVDSSRIELSSTRSNPQIWRNTTALLEVMPESIASK
ncbi:MAG: hypothetical protein PW789_01190 [Edaphobacter sp.]|uniref:hypothetical protein n=1 Tax=Edaphobacter sp. TaxID=1934404 RepID=UPI0023883B13|nr:hypothetical protein [Edaphobacter sp.]MDE1175205.1 hypothetical protein [Edaphobacter sp.]